MTVREILENTEKSLNAFSGSVSFYYENLATGDRFAYRENEPMWAASVIKIPVMISAFTAFSDGRLSRDALHVLSEEEKLPSCGCLNCMCAGIPLRMIDLVNLMIVLSDNTATNLLIRKLGMEAINRDLESFGCRTCRLNRLLFDGKAAAEGLENKVCAAEIADLLKRMYRGKLINAEASAEMLGILKNQKLNGKIPAMFEEKAVIAHKTGEDSGITHDVGIVYGKEPFILCFMGNRLESAPRFNRFMQDTSWALYQAINKGESGFQT